MRRSAESSPGSRLGDAADPAQTFYASDTSFAGTVRLLGDSSNDTLDLRGVTLLGGTRVSDGAAFADAMARQMLELATRLYDDPGVHEAGELAEASVDDLVQILSVPAQGWIFTVNRGGQTLPFRIAG